MGLSLALFWVEKRERLAEMRLPNARGARLLRTNPPRRGVDGAACRKEENPGR